MFIRGLIQQANEDYIGTNTGVVVHAFALH